MTNFLSYTVIGLVVGAVYAISACGLVLTYTTSGIFNFAHGAMGMIAAFLYWELVGNHGWPTLPALLVILGLVAPAMGVLIERFVARPLRGASIEVTLVVTLGLLLALLYLANYVWTPTVPRPLGQFFGTSNVRIVSVNISYHQLTILGFAAAVAIGLWLFLNRTRLGLAMRAVVDDPDLLAMNAADPNRVTSVSWALGASLAGLAGILIAPLLFSLNALTLTILVVNAYAAAMVGRLRSLPLTFAGGLGLGLLVTYGTGYLPQTDFWNRLANGIPTLALFAILLALPAAGVRGARLTGRRTPPVPTMPVAFAAAGVFVAITAVVSRTLDLSNLISFGDVLAFGIIVLSLVLLTGYSGQVSLCQLTFAGVGAVLVGKIGANPVGFLATAVVCGALGALVALPTLRLRGLYLALATLAVARTFDIVIFPQKSVLGSLERLDVGRLPGFTSERMDFLLLGLVFAVVALGLVRLRRSVFGRRLAAMGDSPAACTTLGIDVVRIKLAVFALSAALAGVGGALLGGLHTGVSANDFTMLGSLTLLVLVVLGGVGHVSGALLGSATLAIIGAVKPHVGDSAQRLLDIGPGLVVVLVLSRIPDGVAGWLGRQVERLRARDPRPTALHEEVALRAQPAR